MRAFSTPHTPTPATQLLSNGRYSVMVTAAGSGYSRWNDIAVSRWRDDTTCDDTGSFILLRDAARDLNWSAGFQPSRVEAQRYDVSFTDACAAIVRHDGAIETRLEIVVAVEDDGELRRVSVTNHDAVVRDIDVTSYAEVVLASAASDAAHPAFSNLFIETECDVEREALLATRRRGVPEEPTIWLVHTVTVQGETIGELQWETSRERFLGRGHNVHDPLSEVNCEAALSNTVGPVLDPIVCLRRRVHLRPGETGSCTFATFVATTHEAAVALSDKYRDAGAFDAVLSAQRNAMLASPVPNESQLFQTMAGHILYPDKSLRQTSELSPEQGNAVDALWANGISGDLPIVVVTLDPVGADARAPDAEASVHSASDSPSSDGAGSDGAGSHGAASQAKVQDDSSSPSADTSIQLVRQILRAHTYWRSKCLPVDVIIINDEQEGSAVTAYSQLEALAEATDSALTPEKLKANGKAFAFRAQQLTPHQRNVLENVARVSLSSGRGTLAAQVEAIEASAIAAPPLPVPVSNGAEVAQQPTTSISSLEFFNGFGGFAREGREYVTVLGPGQWTPAPWINVIANANFGCLVSEAGAGCTWSMNSQLNVLTPWSNDPVSDPPAEAFYIRDEESHEVWTPTPLPIREPTGEYVIRHGHGYTRFERESHDIALELLQFVPIDAPLKTSRLTITNRSERVRRLSVTGYLEWVLGTTRSQTAPHISTEMDSETGAMFARNPWNRDFAARVAFADLSGLQQSWTGDRTEFIGRNGVLTLPAALASGAPLSGQVGAALDPCCALQASIEIPAGGHATVVLMLGETQTAEEARALIRRYRAEDLDARLAEVADEWTRVLNTVEVQTPNRALDIMLNDWLLYQTLACRVWARTAFYQASGAYGFRDQLQDVMALAVSQPDVTREQILRAAAHQFVEGDVQHWWHEPSGAGVRTRISDDMLWLPYAVTHYLSVTNDGAVLDEMVQFLDGAALKPGQTDAYFVPDSPTQRGTLFEHCARALDRSLSTGAHGLPLMGTGDWNDGMNRVGAKGRGESVWLAWFFYTNLQSWASVAAHRGDNTRATTWTTHASALKEAAEREAWDGAWYKRAFFDDGRPLGTAGADACAIDAIAQSWSVISGGGDSVRARRAMHSVHQHLVRPSEQLSLLLTPPFDHTALEPGYIKGYVPGVRENGGQYTHGAVWSAIAFAELGDGDTAAELIDMLNPITHSRTLDAANHYRVEPYVMVGDVYSEPPHVGRGGWSWYTGSAGWMYRAGIEWLLGVRVQGRRVLIDPCIPSSWPGFTLTLRLRSSRYDITVENPQGVCRGVTLLELDGIASNDRRSIVIADDSQTHRIRAVLGRTESQHRTNV